MKSKASKPQSGQVPYQSIPAAPIKATQAASGARKSASSKPSSCLKNEYRQDRFERGRSPTVRALLWGGGMKPTKPVALMTPLKNGGQVCHIESVVPAGQLRGSGQTGA